MMSHQHGDRQVTSDLTGIDDSACTIVHVDMDAFFAAVELRRHPQYRGAPMMVAGVGGRGVVLSATYEARAYGIRSAMPTAQALARCPGITVIPPDHAAYAAASGEVMDLLGEITPMLEQVSVDEAFLDVAGALRRAGPPARIAADLRSEIRSRLDLTATVGASSTKFVAKLASSLAKPDGMLFVPPDRVETFLRPLPTRALWGVGPKTAQRLQSMGLVTVGDIADLGVERLTSILGPAAAQSLTALAHGRDDRKVTPDTEEISVGTERTFSTDISDAETIRATLLELSATTGYRARRAKALGRTVVVKIRFEDFTTVTRSETVPAPVADDRDIYAAALRCWDRLAERRPVRLLGVRLENLVAAGEGSWQLALDDDSADWSTAQRTVDAVSEKYGHLTLKPAALLPRHKNSS